MISLIVALYTPVAGYALMMVMNPDYNTFIAPGSAQQKQAPNKKFLLIIGGLLAAVLIAVTLLILGNSGPNVDQLASRLHARLLGTQVLLADGQEHLRSSDLRSTTAETQLVLESDLASLGVVFSYSDEPEDELLSEESAQATIDELGEARLQGNYDEEYRQALSARLESSNALISEIHQATNDAATKAALDEVFAHLSELQDRLAAEE